MGPSALLMTRSDRAPLRRRREPPRDDLLFSAGGRLAFGPYPSHTGAPSDPAVRPLVPVEVPLTNNRSLIRSLLFRQILGNGLGFVLPGL